MKPRPPLRAAAAGAVAGDAARPVRGGPLAQAGPDARGEAPLEPRLDPDQSLTGRQAATDTAGRSSARTRSRTSWRAAMFDIVIACGSVSRRSSSVSPDEEQLAEHHALREAGHQPEADPPRQLLERRGDPPLVARVERGHPVAQHHPVGRPPPGGAARLPRLPDHLGIDRRPLDRAAARVEARQHVEVDEAVVHRRDQRVGRRVRQPRVGAVGARAVDDDVVAAATSSASAAWKRSCSSASASARLSRRARLQHDPPRHRQRQVVPPHVVLPVVEVAEQALLPQVEVERADRMPGAHQRGDQVHGGRRLARTALLVAHDDQSRHPLDHPSPNGALLPARITRFRRSR